MLGIERRFAIRSCGKSRIDAWNRRFDYSQDPRGVNPPVFQYADAKTIQRHAMLAERPTLAHQLPRSGYIPQPRVAAERRALGNVNPNWLIPRSGFTMAEPSIPHVPFVDFQSVFFAQSTEFILKRFRFVVFFLLGNIFNQRLNV